MDPVEDGNPSIGVIVDMFALTDVEELVDIVKEVSVVEINSVDTFVRCDELRNIEKGVEVNLPSDLYNEVPVVDSDNGVVTIVVAVVVLELAGVVVVWCLK